MTTAQLVIQLVSAVAWPAAAFTSIILAAVIIRAALERLADRVARQLDAPPSGNVDGELDEPERNPT